MGKAQLLKDLRESVGSLALEDREFWPAPDFGAGVAKGIVVELLGHARTEWLLSFFAQHPELFIFWCESKAQINPTAIFQRGIALERIKFVNCEPEDLQQSLRLALESKFYPFVVATNSFEDVKIFQRFHFLSEKSKSTLFLLGDQKFSQAWPISLQLEINFSDEGYKIEIQRQKHGVR
jgi:hypothetical protein